MPRKPQDVTDAELAILQLLWDRRQAPARDIAVELYGEATDSSLATVQKLLQRLETKKFVRRNRKAWPHVFMPAVERDELVGRRVQTAIDTLCGGSYSPLLTHLLKSNRLSSEDRDELRNLLDQLDSESKG